MILIPRFLLGISPKTWSIVAMVMIMVLAIGTAVLHVLIAEYLTAITVVLTASISVFLLTRGSPYRNRPLLTNSGCWCLRHKMYPALIWGLGLVFKIYTKAPVEFYRCFCFNLHSWFRVLLRFLYRHISFYVRISYGSILLWCLLLLGFCNYCPK